MAGQPPDSRSLRSWEDAFQHPLPVVRRLEAQLRRNVDDNRQKLRVLVGASYRELLGTAERIIEMDEQLQTVEGSLGEIGQKCNGRVIDKAVENHRRMRMARREEGGLEREERSILAQTKVLQTCLAAAGRIVRARGDALQAAKLYVLARLLHRSISETRRPPVVIGDLRRKVQGLRNKLLSYIEQNMAKISTETTRLSHALGAYVLVASATTKDALRHLLQVRYDQLDRKTASSSEAEVTESLDLYGQTLIDTRELFPRKVADVLGRVSKGALLQDEQVTSIAELSLDVYGSWIPHDIRTFTPWVRQDQLISGEVSEALTAWMAQGRDCLLERLNDHLRGQTDARGILETRQRFLSRVLQLSSQAKKTTSAYGMDDVRAAFLSRLSELAEQAVRMGNFTSNVPHALEPSQTAVARADIWSLASEDFDLGHGGVKLRRSILAARHGRDASMTTEMTKVDDWTKRIHEYLDIADEMATAKWEEDLDFDSELSGAGSLEQELSRKDPELLRDTVRSAVQATLEEVRLSIEAVGDSSTRPGFHLRFWREVETRCRGLDKRLHMSTRAPSLIGLYRNVASVVLEPVRFEFISKATANHSAMALWDGSPPLPVQCTPQTFRFLMSLHHSMTALGSDLWTAACVAELKMSILDKLARELELPEIPGQPVTNERKEAVATLTNGHAGAENSSNGDAEVEEEREEDTFGRDGKGELKHEWVVQHLFDTHYLLHLLSTRQTTSMANPPPLSELLKGLQEHSQLEEANHERLRKSAIEFSKKTYLLFGLLAPARESEAAD